LQRKHQGNKFRNEKCLAKYTLVVVVIDNPYNPASEFVVIPCSDSVVSSVVVIDLRYDVLNYNYLGLKPQLLLITITQIF